MRSLLVLGLGIGVVLWVGCSFNPQPDPPAITEDDTTGTSSGSVSGGMNASTGASGASGAGGAGGAGTGGGNTNDGGAGGAGGGDGGAGGAGMGGAGGS